MQIWGWVQLSEKKRYPVLVKRFESNQNIHKEIGCNTELRETFLGLVAGDQAAWDII